MADIDAFTTYVQGKLTEVMSAADAAATDLENIAEGFVDFFTFNAPPAYDDATQMVNYAPASVTMDAVTPYSAPTAPVLPTVAAPVVTPIAPVDLTQANAALAGFDPASFDPSTVDGEIATLAAKVLAFIDGGGPGISEAIQTALMDNMRERDLQILDDALLRVRSSDSLSGFPFPTSITQAAQNEITKKYQDDYSNRNREITSLMTERAHQTAMNGLNAGVQLTQIKSNLVADVWKLYYSMQGLILDEFKTLLGAEQARVELELKKILADYEVYKAQMLTEYNVRLEEFKVLASGEEVRVRAETTLATAKADVAVKANDHLLKSAVAEVEAQISKWVNTANILTERGKANVNQLVSSNAVRADASKHQATYYASLINACAQMVNTIQVKKT